MHVWAIAAFCQNRASWETEESRTMGTARTNVMTILGLRLRYNHVVSDSASPMPTFSLTPTTLKSSGHSPHSEVTTNKEDRQYTQRIHTFNRNDASELQQLAAHARLKRTVGKLHLQPPNRPIVCFALKWLALHRTSPANRRIVTNASHSLRSWGYQLQIIDQKWPQCVTKRDGVIHQGIRGHD